MSEFMGVLMCESVECVGCSVMKCMLVGSDE